jgi:MtN3 and saliva related transmembrane protein
MITALGLIAGSLTTGAWLPQLARTFRSRSTGDLSWFYLLATIVGIAGWCAYGVLTASVAVMAANGVSGVLLLGVVAIKASARHQPAGATAIGSPEMANQTASQVQAA